MSAVADTYAALCANGPELAPLRARIREFLTSDRAEHGWEPSVDAWLSCWDEGFSARLGSAGFLGLTIPKEYGGQGLGHLHRYVVTEELLAAGAPVAAHWIADRQVGPGLLSYGTEEQRQRILPRIALGKYFSAVIFYLILWLPVLLYFGVLTWVLRGRVEIPRGALGGSYLILFVTGLFHLALGCLASALTRNQIIAAILGFAFIILHFLGGVFIMQQAQDHQEFRPVMDYVAIKGHIESFASGLIDTRPIVYYGSATLLILMLTHQVLEYRRWKS